MEKVRISQYLGHKIILLNFSNLKKADEIREVMSESAPFIRNNSPKSVYTLSNIEGMFFNNHIKELFTKFTGGNKEYVKAAAIIGASGLQSIVINGINRFTGRRLKSFSDEESAREWLVSQN